MPARTHPTSQHSAPQPTSRRSRTHLGPPTPTPTLTRPPRPSPARPPTRARPGPHQPSLPHLVGGGRHLVLYRRLLLTQPHPSPTFSVAASTSSCIAASSSLGCQARPASASGCGGPGGGSRLYTRVCRQLCTSAPFATTRWVSSSSAAARTPRGTCHSGTSSTWVSRSSCLRSWT